MATCNDCIHRGVCAMRREPRCVLTDPPISENIEHECLDFHAKDRFVELPCNMGDTVYIALNGYGVLKDTVKEFRITSRRIWIRPEEFGMDCLLENMAFLTREEAEQAVKERIENDA